MANDYLTKLAYLKLLSSIDGVGPQKIFSLLSKLKSFENIFDSNSASLNNAEGISNTLSIRIRSSKNQLDHFRKETEIELQNLEKIGAKLITYWDNDYPKLLKKIYYPPLVLYILGNLSEGEVSSTLAIVGTRQPSLYGKIQAEKFASELSQNNITIVSGMARGIDSIAHQSALNSKGKTIAVIGSGLDIIYPPENKKLFYDIIENGLVVSEFPLNTKPDAQNFPRRNRIISGLSLGTLIVETKLNGGAMQTAAYAIDQNREIFAVPGNINVGQSEGPNSLIQRSEAKLVINTEDILSELKLSSKEENLSLIKKKQVDIGIFEEKVLETLSMEPCHIDDISIQSKMAVSDCLVNLLTLEFKGLVRQLPGKMFIKS